MRRKEMPWLSQPNHVPGIKREISGPHYPFAYLPALVAGDKWNWGSRALKVWHTGFFSLANFGPIQPHISQLWTGEIAENGRNPCPDPSNPCSPTGRGRICRSRPSYSRLPDAREILTQSRHLAHKLHAGTLAAPMFLWFTGCSFTKIAKII